MKQYRILIAGAGLGGLAAASCLMKAGHRVEIYEQAPQLGEIGAGIQVSANAMHVMRHLGIEDRLLAVGVKPDAYVFRLHDSGEVIQRFSLSQEQLHGAPYTQLHRADLHEILASCARQIDPNIVRLNHMVTGFTESADGVDLHFANRPSVQGDILIGADGVKSVVRAQMFGAAPGDLHRRLGLAPRRSDQSPAEGPARAGDVGVHGAARPCRLLLPSRRHAAQSGRLRRDRRDLRGVLDG